ncbi:helix-turn-helix transcriptional regulator [Hymenobacter actinosclerus]|uniref:Predicted DNA-binding transcriptional regulator YafY, contains an HTH and WYL domains n=1 Tax=Hymenobacter actinosclerus TaxID=82805 RepID=A0A1I0EZC7_9BACT|nr:WYL domain-containing protein [Hymenobacter actinosclerus]SET50291.1 Predicted DNA-binding transcriptional regulator YafY, contains an HTH and WYL domains [Hymenobacter actinosclerus]
MSPYTTLRQLHLITRLQRFPGQPVPFAELRRYLLEQTSVGDRQGSYGERTFGRDRDQIAELFGVSIRSRRHQGYYIAETELLPPGHAALLEALELREFLRLPAALAPFVQAEARRPLGLEYLRPLLRAAQAGHIVELRYQKHWEPAAAPRSLGPLLLRESRGRWYVLGMMEGSGHLACFGLDRIRQLTPTTRPFRPPAGFEAASYFAHCFGITRPTDGQEPARIRLRFAPVQGRYALSYPLHASQQLESETEDAICLSLNVYDTHELRMELLSYGGEVEVLEPPDLRTWLREAHGAAA